MNKIEARAASAEDKLEALNARVNALTEKLVSSATSANHANDDVNEPLKPTQLGMLSQLRQLRHKMETQIDPKKAGKQILEADDGINYRIKFLLDSLEDAESDALN